MSYKNSPSVNLDLAQLNDILIDANRQLSSQLYDLIDPNLARRVVMEMQEVGHRIGLLQSLLFAAESNRISASVMRVKDANAGLIDALKRIDDAVSLVKNVSTFLGLADKVIDLAKMQMLDGDPTTPGPRPQNNGAERSYPCLPK